MPRKKRYVVTDENRGIVWGELYKQDIDKKVTKLQRELVEFLSLSLSFGDA